MIGLFSGENIGSVGLYQPLFPRDFAQGENGTFYVLDRKEQQVRHDSAQIQSMRLLVNKAKVRANFFFQVGSTS